MPPFACSFSCSQEPPRKISALFPISRSSTLVVFLGTLVMVNPEGAPFWRGEGKTRHSSLKLSQGHSIPFAMDSNKIILSEFKRKQTKTKQHKHMKMRAINNQFIQNSIPIHHKNAARKPLCCGRPPRTNSNGWKTPS